MNAALYFIRSFIKKIDVFGQPIQLSFNRHPLQKSFFGGCNTLILLVLFFSVAFQGFLDVITRSNITSYSRDNYELEPPFFDLSPRSMNWAISFKPSDLNLWSNKQFFNIQVLQISNVRDKKTGNITKKKINKEINTRPV